MRNDTATAIGQLDTIAAVAPFLARIVEDLQDTLRTLDKEASRPEAPPRLPDDLVPGFKVNVFTHSGGWDEKKTEKCAAIAAWINSQAILTPEVQAQTDLTDPRD